MLGAQPSLCIARVVVKRVLITGSSGLLGRQIVKLLIDQVDLHIAGRSGWSWEGAEFHALNMAHDFTTESLPNRIDSIIYLAQSDHFRDFPSRADDVFAINVAAPMRLLDYARRCGAKQFIYASSGAVYRKSAQPISEGAAVGLGDELGYYAATKLAAEMLAKNYSGMLDVVLLRFFFIYGVGQKAQMLVPRLIENVRSGIPIQIQGEAGIRINPIVASEAAKAVIAALGLVGSHTINVAGPEVVTIRGLCEEIGHFVGRKPEFMVTDSASDLVADISTMCRLLLAPARRFAEEVPSLVIGDAINKEVDYRRVIS
jgi:UDP-glucose 4-epimerase